VYWFAPRPAPRTVCIHLPPPCYATVLVIIDQLLCSWQNEDYGARVNFYGKVDLYSKRCKKILFEEDTVRFTHELSVAFLFLFILFIIFLSSLIKAGMRWRQWGIIKEIKTYTQLYSRVWSGLLLWFKFQSLREIAFFSENNAVLGVFRYKLKHTMTIESTKGCGKLPLHPYLVCVYFSLMLVFKREKEFVIFGRLIWCDTKLGPPLLYSQKCSARTTAEKFKKESNFWKRFTESLKSFKVLSRRVRV